MIFGDLGLRVRRTRSRSLPLALLPDTRTAATMLETSVDNIQKVSLGPLSLARADGAAPPRTPSIACSPARTALCRPTTPSPRPSCPARPAPSPGASTRLSSSASSSSVSLLLAFSPLSSPSSLPLTRLYRLQQDNEDAFCAALEKDLGRPHFETITAEINPMKAEINDVHDHVAHWAKPTRVKTSPTWVAAKPTIYHEPKGTDARTCLLSLRGTDPIFHIIAGIVLVIGTWNCKLSHALHPARQTDASRASQTRSRSS